MRISLIQSDIVKGDTPANLSHLNTLLPEGSDLIILPEMFHCGFAPADNAPNAEHYAQARLWLEQRSAELNCHICGSLHAIEQGTSYNRLYMASPLGNHTHYDKRHLFSMGMEHQRFGQGKERVITEIAGVKCLLQICYDLRFPAWSRNHNEYDLAIYVANWPASRIDVWLTLLKARAIENQCYVAGVNRVGTDGNIAYNGQSVVFGPRGEIVARAQTDTEDIITAEINIEALHNFRRKFAVLDDADDFNITI